MFANRPGGFTLSWLGVFVVGLLPACVPPLQMPSPNWGQQRAVQFRLIEEVIAGWQADQHVYVQGSLGVGPVQLAELEAWLDEQGKHWTVVLMQEAAGQAFTAADDRHYTGMNAVEFALGEGLNNRTGFGKLEHPLTHEPDGTVFVLFLKERKFSYLASQAQDRRGLGEASWIGQLDQPAVKAMQSGGRILDAVKDTVASINGKLDQAIQREQSPVPSGGKRP